MRVRALLPTLAPLVALTACGSAPKVVPPAPTAVACADAPQLRQRAVDDRRQAGELKSDQDKVYIGSRANFFASLAIIADLKCKVVLPEADEALKPAFEAARKAESTRSFYERAIRWGEADFKASEVIALLVQRLPATPSK